MSEIGKNPASNEAAEDASQAAFGGETTTLMPETATALVELEQVQLRLAEAEERAKNHWEQYLRAVAELENVRKRAQRDIEQANRFGLEKFAQELVPVKDSLDLGVENAPQADAAALAEGQRATQRLLAKAFEKLGITEIDPLGQPFDANFHEAMAMQPSDTAEPNSVLTVVQRGYALNGRLLRPARVIVARAP
ncbi:MAG: nucleotide exchange factor GrpE [Steroidobacteraceae bacterium]|nr:nucleotide exchange factor GrpE [Nevskiaceae bacterium]MCP5467057.1 nucleotide exchange factor GrpE [Nevskiaceae bacterium]MCP5473064.1 nucleotide exchange factor GrpE [Nevskiaceae bacterium]